MKGLNRVVLVGNLGKDPVTKTLDDGREVAKVSVATTDIFRLKDGSNHADTQWHTVIFWGSLAALARSFLKKGSLVYVEGKIRTRTYLDSSGEKRYVTEVIGDRLVMLDRPQRRREEDELEMLF